MFPAEHGTGKHVCGTPGQAHRTLIEQTAAVPVNIAVDVTALRGPLQPCGGKLTRVRAAVDDGLPVRVDRQGSPVSPGEYLCQLRGYDT